MVSLMTFLNNYCNELSGLHTRSLKAFAAKLAECPRLQEPLLLLAIAQNRERYLLRCLPNDGECRRFLVPYHESQLSLEDYLAILDNANRYKKCYNSWKSLIKQADFDRSFLEALSKKLVQLIEEKSVLRADVCRECRLNKGNFYAFLKGDVSKLSRKTAVAVYRYVESL